MKITLLNQLMLILVTFSGIGIAFWCLLANIKAILNKLFFSIVILIVVNIIASFLVQFLDNQNLAFMSLRLVWFTGSLLIPTFYYFSIYFPKKVKSYHSLDILFIILGIVFSILSSFGSLLVKGISVQSWGNDYVYGPGVNYFYAALISSILVGLWIIIKKYVHFQKSERIKIRYFIYGVVIYVSLSIIFSIVYPMLFKTIQFYYLGDYSVVFFLALTAYAIMKHQLFNIKIIATESIVILLSIGLFIQAFISGSTVEYILKFIIWALATYGGWLLIKSVKGEIKQKEELQLLTNKLSDANAHLKDLDKLKDDFLGMASHELNTPLAAIEGYLSMILEEGMGGELQPQTREYLNRIFSSSQRLSAIVKDLLNVSRIESGRIHLLYAEVQIEDLIKQAVAEIDPKVKEKRHTTCLELPVEALPKSWMDPTRITEVLLNLLGNAVKYTDDGGHIEIGAKQQKKEVLIWVKDNGKGIPKDRADRVFAKFTQVDVLKDEVKGTGLGMYISQKFVELHKGKIWFESDGHGKGTTFFVSLPFIKEKPYDPNDGDGPILH